MDASTGRSQSAFLSDMIKQMEAGTFAGEHVCVVNATPKASKRQELDVHGDKFPQVRSYSVGHVADAAARIAACADQQQRDDHERRCNSARRKLLLTYTSITQFSHFVELYRGSVSTVYKAVEVATSLKVVVKAYHKARMQPKHHHKLRREVNIAARMNGDFVAQTYGTIEDADNVYIIMELCEGGDLFKRMMLHGGKLSESYVCLQIVAPLLRVLEKMHRLQLMHRDIKPENIFLTRSGQLKLGDFGLALNFAQEVPFSRSGTLDYMAPEVLKNPASHLQEGPAVTAAHLAAKNIKPYTSQVDVWAVGILAYELVCGKPPFEVDDEAKTASLIMYSTQIQFPAGPSAAWSDFVRAALVKNPLERADAAQLLQHPWVLNHLHRSRTSCGGSGTDYEKLMYPLPLQACPPLPERQLSRELSAGPPTPNLIAAVTLTSKESMTLNPASRASSSASLTPAASGGALSRAHSTAAAAAAADGGGYASPTAHSPPARSGSSTTAAAAAGAGLPPRASPLSKGSSVSMSGRAPASDNVSLLALQSLSDPGAYSSADALQQSNDQQVAVQQYAKSSSTTATAGREQPSTPTKPSRKPAPLSVFSGHSAVHPAVHHIACPPSPCAHVAGDGMCDSPHAGPGTKERLKWYLQHQKVSHAK